MRSDSKKPLLLVGGFGDSTHLNKRLNDWCRYKLRTQVTFPSECVSAGFRGAALRTLLGPRIQDRRARRHYGYSTRGIFRERYDDEPHAVFDDFSGERFREGIMYWIIEKTSDAALRAARSRAHLSKDAASADINTRFQLYHSIPEGAQSRTVTELRSSTNNEALEFMDKSTMQKAGDLAIDYPEDILRQASSQYNSQLRKRVRNVQAKFEVEARADESVLVFKAFTYGKETGETTIQVDG